MLKRILFLFLICIKMLSAENIVYVNYVANEPILGKNYYLGLSDIPISTYSNTIGYFSTVNIVGKNLRIEKDLEKIIVKKDEKVLIEKNVLWEKYNFEIENLDLDGLNINLRWTNLNRQKMELMLSKWNLEKESYEIEIEYIYPKGKKNQKLIINMPEFNPDIYLNFEYKTPILKRQEYNKKYLLIKEISLNDYDLEITKNDDNPDGLKLTLNKSALIEGETKEKEKYANEVKIVSLIEKYPGIFIEEPNAENILKKYKSIFIGVELPKDIEYNQSYKIFGDILKVEYGKIKKILIDKIIITGGINEVNKTIGITNWHRDDEKIYIDNIGDKKGYYELESNNKVQTNYRNLKIKINEKEETVDEKGNSKVISFKDFKIKVENGVVCLTFNDLYNFKQGFELKYEIINNNSVVDRVNLKFYKEN